MISPEDSEQIIKSAHFLEKEFINLMEKYKALPNLPKDKVDKISKKIDDCMILGLLHKTMMHDLLRLRKTWEKALAGKR